MTDSDFQNGPHLSSVEFDQLFNRLKSWDEYSPATIERGALNHITAETVKTAIATVKNGRVIQMALPWATVSGPDNSRPALHYMTSVSEPSDEQPTSNTDFIGVDYHGKATSHMDAMTHIVYKDKLFGGKNSSEMVNSHGSRWSTIDKLGPVVTRGVLLDAARFKAVEWLEPGTAVHAADVLAMEERYGITIGAGDCILLRSGHFNRRAKLGVWNPDNFSAGFHVDVMELFKERKVSMIGGDGDSDVRPSPVDGVGSPIHILALPGLGIPLLDNLHLEALGDACAIEGRQEFLITIAPLNVVGGTGSPVNPIAVL
jgi:kynurenine formamidase